MSLISLFDSKYKNIRKAGYIKDQKGIIKRYGYEYENWLLHLENCKSFIAEKASSFSGGKVAVLGSGWLLDVPVDNLLNNFDQIDFFDIYHPAQIKRKYINNPKISFIVKDLTNGLINKVYNSKKLPEILTAIRDKEPVEFNVNYDFVISLNLLNQLDILLVDFIRKKFKIKQEIMNKIRFSVQQNHIDMLMNFNTCLITDAIEQIIKNDEIIEEKNLIYGNLPENKFIKSWIWTFDTQMTYNAKNKTSFIVKAYQF